MAVKTPRDKVQVLVYTTTHRIEGSYFKMQDSRLIDDINGRKDFVPMTQTKVSSLADGGPVAFESELLLVNRHQIVFLCAGGTGAGQL